MIVPCLGSVRFAPLSGVDAGNGGLSVRNQSLWKIARGTGVC